MGSLSERHRVAELDLLREEGPGSLESLAEELDPAQALVIVTEGLLTYLDDETTDGLWARLAQVLERFSEGVYLSDLRFARPERGLAEHAFDAILAAFVRDKVHPYRGDEAAAKAALRGAGFKDAQLHRGNERPAAAGLRDPGASVVCIIEATANGRVARGE
jgi:O-methyltransferase involved in polyketide biosynthesis